MKAVIASILSIYVLAGSIGTPFSKHTCLAMDKTEYGFVLEDTCCGNNDKGIPGFSATGCCEFISAYLQVDYESFSYINFFSFSAPQVLDPLYIFIEEASSSILNNIEESSPPLLYGRSLLSFVQSFII